MTSVPGAATPERYACAKGPAAGKIAIEASAPLPGAADSKDDPTLLGVTVSGVGFLFIGPLSLVLGAAAFFVPHLLRAHQ